MSEQAERVAMRLLGHAHGEGDHYCEWPYNKRFWACDEQEAARMCRRRICRECGVVDIRDSGKLVYRCWEHAFLERPRD